MRDALEATRRQCHGDHARGGSGRGWGRPCTAMRSDPSSRPSTSAGSSAPALPTRRWMPGATTSSSS